MGGGGVDGIGGGDWEGVEGREEGVDARQEGEEAHQEGEGAGGKVSTFGCAEAP